jgi:hypothetical protein
MLKWSSSIERASYVIGLATTTFLAAVAEILAFTFYKNSNFPIPKIIFLGVGLGVMYLYDYIYIKKERYNSIIANNNFDSKDYKNGVIISWVTIVVCVFLPFIIYMFFVPFGSQKSMSMH